MYRHLSTVYNESRKEVIRYGSSDSSCKRIEHSEPLLQTATYFRRLFGINNEEGKVLLPRILMAGSTRNEKIDQIGKTMDVDIKAYIRELFSDVWIKEYGSTQNLFENAPDVLKVKADLSALVETIRKKRKMYYDWKDKVLFVAEKKGNLKLMPVHPPAQKIHGVWMDCVVYGKRRFHRYSAPEKAAEYELKYPDATDYGLDGYLNYTIYSSDEN